VPFDTIRFSSRCDNNPRSLQAKADIRRRVLTAVGRPAGVFDAFAGAGEMYSAVLERRRSLCRLRPQMDRGGDREGR
jgi:hypothetical protein